MKKILVLLAAMFISISVGMATITPTWLENLEVGTTYTYGEYKAATAVVEDSYTPQGLISGFGFSSPNGDALILQEIDSSVSGVPVGIDRQLLAQSASASITTGPSLDIDAEKGATAITEVLTLSKDQSALYSGKLVAGPVETISNYGYDINGDGINDDPYSGGHGLIWNTYDQQDPAFTTSFYDDASVSSGYSYESNEAPEVVLREHVDDARVTISAAPVDLTPDGDVVFQIDPNSYCDGAGQYWQGYAQAGYPWPPTTQTQVSGFPDAPVGSNAQLTEVAASLSSDASLTTHEIMNLGNIETYHTLDGSASLSGAFENALVDPGQPVNIDLDGDVDQWFEEIIPPV